MLDRREADPNYRAKPRRVGQFNPLVAFVYIDPGVGSLILQVLAAAVISAVAFVGNCRRAVRAFFSRLTRRPQ
jgi:hypothetical protein